jgi:hypothetical protein
MTSINVTGVNPSKTEKEVQEVFEGLYGLGCVESVVPNHSMDHGRHAAKSFIVKFNPIESPSFEVFKGQIQDNTVKVMVSEYSHFMVSKYNPSFPSIVPVDFTTTPEYLCAKRERERKCVEAVNQGDFGNAFRSLCYFRDR